MADKQKLAKLASKYIPKKVAEKKIKDFGAKTSGQLKGKVDSARNASNDYAEKSRYALTSLSGDQGSNLKGALKASNRFDRLSGDADYMASKMQKSIAPMYMRESAQTAKSKMAKLSTAPTDATSVARISVPLAETQFHK
jgi:hypothetical protein